MMTSLEDFRAARLAALVAGDGWLNLTDRVDLTPGTHSLGRAPDNDLVISAGPLHLGTLRLDARGGAELQLPGGQTHAFQPHPDAFPRLAVAGLMLEIHTVEGIPALRVRDVNAPARANFPGLRHFPTAAEWVVRAEWRRLPAPQVEEIDMKGGRSDTVTITHQAHFVHDGRPVALSPTHLKAGKPMFVFRDATAGRETYGACRFLFGEDIDGDRITLDFNRAHNPPCAYSAFAICPLPPPGNVLPFPIRAGELAPL